MARHRFALVFLSVLCLLTSRLSAAEPYLEFVEALRDREYFDTALEYLEAAEARTDLPPDIKAVIPFEKAATLIQLAKTQRNPEAANATLGRAQAFLEQFLKANPDHPKAAKANSDAGNVLVGKGKVAVIQARSPSNANKRADFLKGARDNFEAARKLFQDAATKYDKQWQAFGPFVDSAKEPEKFEAKGEAERMKIRAELDVAIVQYEEAQAYEKDDPKYQSTLKDAAGKFELIHQKHRSQVAGLYARMYQGKCFEEQGDLQKALGLYGELLSHNPDSNVMKNLQAQVTHFKLICLNSDKKADYILVDKLADEWIKANPQMIRTRYGTGIRYEKGRALENMAKARDVKPEEKKKILTEALGLARLVNRTGGEYRDPSQAMITRLMAALNYDGTDPKDFETAYGKARELVNKIKETKDLVRGAKDPEEIKRYQKSFEAHLEETARMLNLALSLRKADSKVKEVNTCRYSLSYVYYEQRRSYDSAVLGEFVGRRYAKDEESESLPADSAYLAMAAYAQAYNAKGNNDKQADIQKVIGISDFIVATWPGTPKAIEALEMLGKMYLQIKDYGKAAETFEKVPADSASYLKVQLMLGQTLWEAAIEGYNKPEGERPPPAKLLEYQTKAQETLKKVIATLEPKLADNEVLPDDLATAKLTLAQIANQTTQYADALKLLETDKRSVITAIAVAEGEKRPANGVKSGRFAQEVYKQILRSYIGLQNLENARKAMTELEKIAAGQGQDILPIYIALGKQFKEELDRLAKANPDQHKTVLKSFESFLSNMLARKEGQNYNSLAWIGAMYVSLGEGTPDKTVAATYFAQGSKAYNELIDKAGTDPMFCNDQQLLAAKAQLVACKRKAGEFEAAVEGITELLQKRKNAIDTQTEACYVFQDWAAAGTTESPKQWAVAMSGDKALTASKQKPIGMWGWAELSKRLMQSPEAAKYMDSFLEARYNIALCRFKAAAAMPDGGKAATKKTGEMGRAITEIQRTAMQINMNETQYAKFNVLHREIQTAMNLTPTDIVRNPPESDVADAKAAEAKEALEERKAAAEKKKKLLTKKNDAKGAKKEEKAETSSMFLMGGVLLLF
ncbi:MAG: hypothetical protein JWN70_3856, partial [Planctomycetaceae bacterium]|nr:hypothetical protein [Planctomycetaceae bacterium]